MEDISIQPIGINIIAPDEDSTANFLQVVVVKGITLPFADPSTGEPLQVPSGQYRVPMNREFAIKFADRLKEEAEKLPEERKSDLQVVSSLSGIDKAIELERQIRAN